jgi:hypothetical protein
VERKEDLYRRKEQRPGVRGQNMRAVIVVIVVIQLNRRLNRRCRLLNVGFEVTRAPPEHDRDRRSEARQWLNRAIPLSVDGFRM